MPEDEAKQEQPKDGAGGGGFAMGSKGWIIVIAVVVLEAVVFLTMMHFQNRSVVSKGPDDNIKKPGLKDFMNVVHTIENLNYSIPTQSGTTSTLSASIQIVLEKTQDDLLRNVEITKEDWAKFRQAVQKMEPKIRDRLMEYVSKQTYNQLNSTRGKKMLRDYVMEYVNNELDKLDLELSSESIAKRRVTDVLIVSFYLQ